MSVPGQPDANFQKFFSTPSAFHSIVISNPDKPPQAAGIGVREEEEEPDTSSFTADKVKVASPSIPKLPTGSAASTYSRPFSSSSTHRSARGAPPTSAPPKQPPPPEESSDSDLFLKRGDVIGRGSFGTVYRCLDLKTGRMLADKEFIFESSGLDQQVLSTYLVLS